MEVPDTVHGVENVCDIRHVPDLGCRVHAVMVSRRRNLGGSGMTLRPACTVLISPIHAMFHHVPYQAAV